MSLNQFNDDDERALGVRISALHYIKNSGDVETSITADMIKPLPRYCSGFNSDEVIGNKWVDNELEKLNASLEPPVESQLITEPSIEQSVTESPIDTPPVEQSPTDQPPVEQSPTNQPPVEQSPVEPLIEQSVDSADTAEESDNSPQINGGAASIQWINPLPIKYVKDGIVKIKSSHDDTYGKWDKVIGDDYMDPLSMSRTLDKTFRFANMGDIIDHYHRSDDNMHGIVDLFANIFLRLVRFDRNGAATVPDKTTHNVIPFSSISLMMKRMDPSGENSYHDSYMTVTWTVPDMGKEWDRSSIEDIVRKTISDTNPVSITVSNRDALGMLIRLKKSNKIRKWDNKTPMDNISPDNYIMIQDADDILFDESFTSYIETVRSIPDIYQVFREIEPLWFTITPVDIRVRDLYDKPITDVIPKDTIESLTWPDHVALPLFMKYSLNKSIRIPRAGLDLSSILILSPGDKVVYNDKMHRQLNDIVRYHVSIASTHASVSNNRLNGFMSSIEYYNHRANVSVDEHATIIKNALVAMFMMQIYSAFANIPNYVPDPNLKSLYYIESGDGLKELTYKELSDVVRLSIVYCYDITKQHITTFTTRIGNWALAIINDSECNLEYTYALKVLSRDDAHTYIQRESNHTLVRYITEVKKGKQHTYKIPCDRYTYDSVYNHSYGTLNGVKSDILSTIASNEDMLKLIANINTSVIYRQMPAKALSLGSIVGDISARLITGWNKPYFDLYDHAQYVRYNDHLLTNGLPADAIYKAIASMYVLLSDVRPHTSNDTDVYITQDMLMDMIQTNSKASDLVVDFNGNTMLAITWIKLICDDGTIPIMVSNPISFTWAYGVNMAIGYLLDTYIRIRHEYLDPKVNEKIHAVVSDDVMSEWLSVKSDDIFTMFGEHLDPKTVGLDHGININLDTYSTVCELLYDTGIWTYSDIYSYLHIDHHDDIDHARYKWLKWVDYVATYNDAYLKVVYSNDALCKIWYYLKTIRHMIVVLRTALFDSLYDHTIESKIDFLANCSDDDYYNGIQHFYPDDAISRVSNRIFNSLKTKLSPVLLHPNSQGPITDKTLSNISIDDITNRLKDVDMFEQDGHPVIYLSGAYDKPMIANVVNGGYVTLYDVLIELTKDIVNGSRITAYDYRAMEMYRSVRKYTESIDERLVNGTECTDDDADYIEMWRDSIPVYTNIVSKVPNPMIVAPEGF